jgi:leucine dehydrogenase
MASPFAKQVLNPKDIDEFDEHRLVSFAYDEESDLFAVIAIHRTNKGIPSFGATRMWHYPVLAEGISDALRLSRLMSYKAALAGLPCGGAKAVIIERPEYLKNPETRKKALQAYADRVNLLDNSFVTGTDVGISQEDLHTMKSRSSQVIGFNDNTTEFTGLGVFESIKASLGEAFGSEEIAGRKFAIQGLGKIGTAVLEQLVPIVGASEKIYVSDINPKRVEEIKSLYPQVEVVAPKLIHALEVDVFSPCALGAALNNKSVGELKAKVVAGGANNQLESEQMGDTLFARGIVYAPDYIANAGGLIAIYDEFENPGTYQSSVVREKVAHIPKTLKAIFGESHEKHLAPHRVANEMAERIFNAYA